MTLKTKKLQALTLLIILIGCGSQVSRQSNTESSREDTFASELLLEDLKTLKYWINEAHGDPYRFISKEELDHLFDQKVNEVQKAGRMTEYEFLGQVLPIMAELRDGHSQVFPSDLDRIEGNVILPFKIRFVNKQAYILENYSGRPLKPGMRLTKIDDVDAKAYFDRLLPLVHRDGNIESIRYRRLEHPIYLARMMKALGLSKETHVIEVDDGVPKEFIIHSLDQSTYNRARKGGDRASEKIIELAFKETATATVPVLKICSFNPHYFNDSYETFTGQVDLIMDQVAESGAEKLILDLRNNSGGEDTYALYLLRYLMNKEFKYHGEVQFRKNDYRFLPDGKHWDIDPRCFKPNERGTYDATDYLWPDAPSSLGSFDPFKNRFRGELVVLINAFTFSAATEVATILHHAKRAEFIGEETGGSYVGNISGYIPTLRLPNSRLQINLALISIRRSFFEDRFIDRGVVPDIPVEPTIEDLISKNDIQLEQALLRP